MSSGASSSGPVTRRPVPQVDATGEERRPVQRRHQQQQCLVAGQQRDVLEQATHHGTQQVGAEGDVRLLDVPEALGEDQVGDEDRREPDRDRQQEARQHLQAKQELDGHHPGDRERREQRHVQQGGRGGRQRRATSMAASTRDQHAGEDERVDEPGGAEQQRELDDALGLEQQERGAHEEEVERTSPSVATGRTTRTRPTDATRMSSKVTR